jgi:hypothetical protein
MTAMQTITPQIIQGPITETPRPAGTEYFVYGSYGYQNEEVIHQGTDFGTALDAFHLATDDPDDMNGHQVVELASFAEDGEYLTHDAQRA